MEPDAAKILKRMVKATDPACGIALEYYGKTRGALKRDMTCVTEADTAIEDLLRKKLPPIIGDSAVVGEEIGISGDAAREARAKEWVWVIDPIDGTGAFIDGIPTFCISVGLLRDGNPYAGALRFPATGDIYEAARGYGAFYNGKRINISASAPLRHEAPICVTSKAHLKFRISYGGKTRNIGSAAAHIALVARGAALGAVGEGSVWDFAGAAAILLEAGGAIRYLDGSPVNWRAAFSTRGRLRMPAVSAARGRWKQVASYIKFIGKD